MAPSYETAPRPASLIGASTFRLLEIEVAHVVAGIAARVLLEVVLVLLLRRPERAGGGDLRHHRLLPLVRGVHLPFHLLRHALLLVGLVEDGRAVRDADVVA